MAQEWWPRHAFQWEGQVYQDLRMPFGSKGAPTAFDRITQLIERQATKRTTNASAKQRTQAGFKLVTATVRLLGFGSDGSKNQAPAQQGIFLGGGLDSNTDGTAKCSKFIDTERKEYVVDCCFEMENRKGAVM
eukprot:9309973-Pyramimonas_sp.AAC.1